MSEPALRASDDDRDIVLQSLERHFAAGRINPEEFDQRSTAALVAVTLTDLAELTGDLPELTGGPPPPPGTPTSNAHHLVLAFVIAFATLAVVVAMMLLHP